MSVPLNRLPSEDALRRIQAGFEAIRGVPGTVDFKLYGNLAITRDRPIVDVPEFDGTYDGDIDPTFGPYTFGGTYSQGLTYEDFPVLMELGVKGGVAAVSDGEGVPGYLWTHEPTRSLDDLASVTIEHGYPGMVSLAEQVMMNDFTISIDADDSEAVWQFSSNLWVRTSDMRATTSVTATGGSTSTLVDSGAAWTVNQFAGSFVFVTSGPNAGEVIQVLSNTATTLTFVGILPNAMANTNTAVITAPFTPSISDRTRERIKGPGTRIFADSAPGGTLGTTEIEHGFISMSLTHNNALASKRYLNDVDTMSRKIGRGKRSVTGQFRFEFDTRAQYDQYIADLPQMIRVQQEGSAINGHSTLPNKLARIDLHRIYWGAPSESLRGTNITATFPFRAFYNTTTSKRVQYISKNKLSAML
jgi:hypothetical protein